MTAEIGNLPSEQHGQRSLTTQPGSRWSTQPNSRKPPTRAQRHEALHSPGVATGSEILSPVAGITISFAT
jgi:hypothetical protein